MSRTGARSVSLLEVEKMEFYPLEVQQLAPDNGWLEDEIPFGIPYFQGLC